ncbi:MAG: hypothetical protein IJ644_00570 [Oscillospiraceae bacterium]|nr:hypothetical protein [Oscillospiraceae bacterium]
MQEDLHRELRAAVIGTVILDVLFWTGSLFVTGFSTAFLTGLFLGSIGSLSNLFLLRRSILNAVYHGKTRDFKGYLIRMLIASAVIAAGLISEQVNAVACVMPFLYPKIIFGILSFRTDK